MDSDFLASALKAASDSDGANDGGEPHSPPAKRPSRHAHSRGSRVKATRSVAASASSGAPPNARGHRAGTLHARIAVSRMNEGRSRQECKKMQAHQRGVLLAQAREINSHAALRAGTELVVKGSSSKKTGGFCSC